MQYIFGRVVDEKIVCFTVQPIDHLQTQGRHSHLMKVAIVVVKLRLVNLHNDVK